MKYPLKLIEWHDAYAGNHDWFDAADLPKEVETVLIKTVGFEVYRTETQVTLAMSVSPHDQLRDLFTIPLAMIVREQTFRSRLTQEKKDV